MIQNKADFLDSYRFACGLTCKNRVAMAPMTNGQSQVDGCLGEDEFLWLERRAQGGFGMIITCASHISETAKAWEGELGCHSDLHDEGLKRLSAVLKANGATSIMQLFHGGVRSPFLLTGVQPISASAFKIDVPGFEVPREANETDIEIAISDFVSAAKRVVAAGFDGVEIHGANGYLITQFLSSSTNLRTDKWGGSLENRMRLGKEILTRVRTAIGPNKILGIRISPENAGVQTGIDVDETVEVAKQYAAVGLDYFHLSLVQSNKEPSKYPGSGKTIVQMFRDVLPKNVALMASGKIWTAADAEATMALGVEFVSLGKAAISHPDWPNAALEPGFAPEKFPILAKKLDGKAVGKDLVALLGRMNLIAPE